MSIPTPEQRSWRSLTRQAPAYDMLVAVFVATVGYLQSSRFIADGWRTAGAALAVVTTAICGLSVAKGLVLLREQRRTKSLHELEGCLETLYSVLSPIGTEDEGLRLSVHVAIENGQKFQQVLDYVGDPRADQPTAARVFPAQSGIAGKVLRTKEAYAAARENDLYEDYIRELVESWNFTEADARRLNPATMAWMAVPITNLNGALEGVLYLDATDRDFFTEERQWLAIQATTGIAKFVARRYT
jgi:hypothetical protein